MLGFYPLSGSPISSSGSLIIQLSASISTSVTTNPTLLVQKNSSASISGSLTVAPKLTLGNNSSASITGTLTTAPKLVLVNNSSASATGTLNVTPTLLVVKNSASSVSGSLTTNSVISIQKNSSSSINVALTTNASLSLVKNIASSISTSLSATSTLSVVKNSSASINGSLTTSPSLSVSLMGSISTTVSQYSSLSVGLFLQISGSATANVTLSVVKNPVSSINLSGNTTGLIQISKKLSASINASELNAALLLQYQLLSSNLTSSITTNASLSVSLMAIVANSISTTQPLTVIKHLNANILANSNINVGTPVEGNITLKNNVYALLDVNGNTWGYPGGSSVLGFYPLSALTLAQQSESSNSQTYQITASFSNEPSITTEIIEVDFDDNPADVLSYSINNNVVNVSVNTPKLVYKESSTFLVQKEVVPLFNVSYNYTTKFNTKIKQSRAGKNFYSGKFYVEGGYLCELKDDGYGNINLYEFSDAINSSYSKTVGSINYDNGYIFINNLYIHSIPTSQLFFYVESLDDIIPTTDYFNYVNSLTVQSRTITFPSGEIVEISEYKKSTELVELYVYVKARSYAVSNPTVTLETREVLYKIVIFPDYDSGKNRILSMVTSQES